MRYGSVGLGHLGAQLAGSLLREGFSLTVTDLNGDLAAPLLARGARWADSPKAAASECDAVITCLPSPAVSQKVLCGPVGILSPLERQAADNHPDWHSRSGSAKRPSGSLRPERQCRSLIESSDPAPSEDERGRSAARGSPLWTAWTSLRARRLQLSTQKRWSGFWCRRGSSSGLRSRSGQGRVDTARAAAALLMN